MTRLSNHLNVDEFWLATTDREIDDGVTLLGQKSYWQVFRGETENVISRFLTILQRTEARFFVRCTGDNPLTDPWALNAMLDEMKTNASQAVSIRDELHAKIPIGLLAEVVDAERFKSLVHDKDLPRYHQTNVTSIILELALWKQPIFLDSYLELTNQRIRLTVDYPEDYRFMVELISLLGADWKNSSVSDVLNVLEQNPTLSRMNGHLTQRHYTE